MSLSITTPIGSCGRATWYVVILYCLSITSRGERDKRAVGCVCFAMLYVMYFLRGAQHVRPHKPGVIHQNDIIPNNCLKSSAGIGIARRLTYMHENEAFGLNFLVGESLEVVDQHRVEQHTHPLVCLVRDPLLHFLQAALLVTGKSGLQYFKTRLFVIGKRLSAYLFGQNRIIGLHVQFVTRFADVYELAEHEQLDHENGILVELRNQLV